jgi:DNA uptake protein ComE-like DNA-binding protein
VHPDIRAYRNAVAINRISGAVAQAAPYVDFGRDKDELLKALLNPPQQVESETQSTLQNEANADAIEAIVAKFVETMQAGAGEYDFSVAVGKDGNDALRAAGYHTPEDIKEATDEDLLEVEGIGPKKVAALRELFPAEGESDGEEEA